MRLFLKNVIIDFTLIVCLKLLGFCHFPFLQPVECWRRCFGHLCPYKNSTRLHSAAPVLLAYAMRWSGQSFGFSMKAETAIQLWNFLISSPLPHSLQALTELLRKKCNHPWWRVRYKCDKTTKSNTHVFYLDIVNGKKQLCLACSRKASGSIVIKQHG